MTAKVPPVFFHLSDNPEIVEQVGLMLYEYDYQSFTNPQQLLDASRATPPHLFLLDTHVLGVDVGQLAKELRQHPVLGQIPIAFVQNGPGSPSYFRRLGRDVFLPPFDRDNLRHRLFAILSQVVVVYDAEDFRHVRLFSPPDILPREDFSQTPTPPPPGVVGLLDFLRLTEPLWPATPQLVTVPEILGLSLETIVGFTKRNYFFVIHPTEPVVWACSRKNTAHATAQSTGGIVLSLRETIPYMHARKAAFQLRIID